MLRSDDALPRRRDASCWPSSASRCPTRRAPVSSLSGGQRQLLAVARAMCGEPAAADPRRADRVARRQRVGAGRGADGRACASAARRCCSSRTTSTRCSGSPTASSSCATAGSSPTCDPARVASRRRRRADLRPADRLLGAPPAQPPARPRRPARVGRPVLEPAADPLGARRRARHRAALHPPASTGDALRIAGELGLPPALVARLGRAAVRRRRRPGRARRRRPRRRSSTTTSARAPRGRRGSALAAGARRSRSSWAVPVIGANGPGRRDHRLPPRARAARRATSSTSSRSTPATPRAPSSASGCSAR